MSPRQYGLHFQITFFVWSFLNYDSNFTEICLQKCNWWHPLVGSDNGLAPKIRPLSKPTRTTRTPAFWGYPPPPHDYPYHWVILDPKLKEDKVKVTNLKNSNFLILKRALHETHLRKLLDKMCKYEMDLMSIIEDTEQTRFCPQTDRRTDGQGDTSIPPFQLRWSGGYNDSIG